jgi:sporulation related protein
MAESNHRSYRDPAAARSAPTPPRDQPDDPLAGLARLIGQSLITNDLRRDARRPTATGSRSAREFNPSAQHGYAAPTDVLQETTEEQSSAREQGSYDFDPPNGKPDEGRYEALPRADVSPRSRSAWYEREPDAADPNIESSSARYDDYEDQSHDHSDDHANGEDYDEHPIPRRRGGLIFVAAVFGLALLGTAGAFAFRAPFADSIVPSLLSIIKAQGRPNKIVPTSTAFQGNVSPQADADNAGSSERLVPNEDRLADVPPLSTASQPVPAPAPEPGAASVIPPTPLAQPAPAARVEILNSPPAAPVPPIPSADQAAAPAAPIPTAASPTKPRPKKIRTVSIRTDQPNGSESAASQPQSIPVRPTTQQEAAKASDANGPLSIVPSSNDAARAAAGSERTAPSARPASVGKPAATKIASTSASGGGYAVQVSSQRNEKEVQPSFRALQAKYSKLLGGREPMVRRTDLGAKGIYYRTMVGPFVSAEQANELCSNLKAAGGSCIVQKN